MKLRKKGSGQMNGGMRERARQMYHAVSSLNFRCNKLDSRVPPVAYPSLVRMTPRSRRSLRPAFAGY